MDMLKANLQIIFTGSSRFSFKTGFLFAACKYLLVLALAPTRLGRSVVMFLLELSTHATHKRVEYPTVANLIGRNDLRGVIRV